MLRPGNEELAPEQVAADPSELAQKLKSQLLPGDKAFNKNQRKKARKKVSKLVHKALGIPRPRSDEIAAASPENGSAPIMSGDTGCSGRRPGRTSDPPACTSARLAGGSAPHPPPSSPLHPPHQRVMTRAPGGADEAPSPPPPKRRRVQTVGSLASGLSGAPTRSQHTSSRNLESGSTGAAAAPSSGVVGGGGGCSSNQLSRGAQKRLSRRQAQPEDLLTGDDGDGGGSGCVDGTASGAVGGAGSREGAATVGGAGGNTHGEWQRRDREWQHNLQKVRQRGQQEGRRRGKGGQRDAATAAVAVAGSSVVTCASEEVLQRPQAAATAASAAAAAVAAVHRGGGGGYTMYGGMLAAVAAASTRRSLGLAATGTALAGAGGGGGGGASAAAGRGSVDFSAALLMMRVQLRATATATTSSGSGEGMAGDGGRGGMKDTNSAGGTAIPDGYELIGGGSSAVAVAAATAMTSSGFMDADVQIEGSLELDARMTAVQPKQKQKGRAPEGQAAAKQPAPERSALNRYGNYHRYYGYRLGSELDKDPRVKLMKPEWFQQRVCVDVGCNEGLVTLAVAARFGAKRMTGYDIDGTLIKKACKNLRVVRSEYTARLQALSRGGAGAGAFDVVLGGGSAGSQGEDDIPTAVGAAGDDDGCGGGQPFYGDEQPNATGPFVRYGDNTAECDDSNDDQYTNDGDGGCGGDGNGDGDGGLAGGEEEGRGAAVGGEGGVSGHAMGEHDEPTTAAASGGRPMRLAPPRGPHPAAAPTPRRTHLAAGPPPLQVGLLRSFVRSLAGTRFVQQDWANARGRPESSDTILCLSVTKWVHLNNGDEGLKRLFKKFFDTLTPGGLLVLEPQPWKSYKRAVHKSTTNAVPFKRIEQLKLRPQHFVDYLTNVVGFTLEAQLREGGATGFDRPIFLLRKPQLMTPIGTTTVVPNSSN